MYVYSDRPVGDAAPSLFSFEAGRSVQACLFNALFLFSELCRLGLPNTRLMHHLLRTVVDKRLAQMDSEFGDSTKLAAKASVHVLDSDVCIRFKVFHKETLKEYMCYVERATDDLHVVSSTTLDAAPTYVTDTLPSPIRWLA